MGAIFDAFKAAFRDYNTDGVPASLAHNVVKADVRALGSLIEAQLVKTVRLQRSVTGLADLPATAADQILNVNAVADLFATVPIPLGSTRAGSGLTIKNLSSSVTQTLTATAPKTFDGQSSYKLVAGAEITLRPFVDGVNDPDNYALA
jgi:hypothetical protein